MIYFFLILDELPSPKDNDVFNARTQCPTTEGLNVSDFSFEICKILEYTLVTMCLSVIMKELLLVVVKLLASEKHRMSHHSRVKKISTSAGVNLTQFMRE